MLTSYSQTSDKSASTAEAVPTDLLPAFLRWLKSLPAGSAHASFAEWVHIEIDPDMLRAQAASGNYYGVRCFADLMDVFELDFSPEITPAARRAWKAFQTSAVCKAVKVKSAC